MSPLLPSIPPAHILPLLIGTIKIVACIPTYFNVSAGIRAFGFPEHIASSPAAHSSWILYTSRMHAVGIMLLVFYAQCNYAAVDTVMASMAFFGAVDVWVCAREGVDRKATLMRGLVGGGVWGLWVAWHV